MFFMFVIASAGILRIALTIFQPFFVQAKLKKTFIESQLPGITRLISEVGVYFFSKEMSEMFGVYWMLVFSQIAGICRTLGYGLMNPSSKNSLWISLALESFKGLNSGLISSSAIRIAADIAPAGCESSAQGLYSGNYSGLSAAFGGTLSGIIIYVQKDKSTALQKMFVWVSIISSVITVLFTLKYMFVDRVMGLPCFPRKRQSKSH